MAKRIFVIEQTKAEGGRQSTELLGRKGAILAEMANIPLPVPPGFTITTRCCREFLEGDDAWASELTDDLDEALAQIEEAVQRTFGRAKHPLLLSVRSSPPVSMPGMLDTVLNVGMNRDVVEALIEETGKPRFAWDCYRRLIQGYGSLVSGVDQQRFEEALQEELRAASVRYANRLNSGQMRSLTERFLRVYAQETKDAFPEDPRTQLRQAVRAVFQSWDNPRAVTYRRLNDIPHRLGTAVMVQSMIFGNMGLASFAGVVFTRNPGDGTNELYGEYLVNSQGVDLAQGARTPRSIHHMPEEQLEEYDDEQMDLNRKEANWIYRRLFGEIQELKEKLEAQFDDMQDVEFTVQEGTLYVLQSRPGERTASAAVKVAVDMVNEELIDVQTAVLRVKADQVEHLLNQQFEPKDKTRAEEKGRLLTTGLPASPGVCVGRIALTPERAEEMAEDKTGEPVVLVRDEAVIEDVNAIHAAAGILNTWGGMTSHGAILARSMGKCCIVGCGAVQRMPDGKQLKIAGKQFEEGDYLALDGYTGEVFEGKIKLRETTISGPFAQLMEWADSFRKIGDKRFGVRTNADTPELAEMARQLGADGIGLCRTEHMFLKDENRQSAFQQMILTAPRKKQLATATHKLTRLLESADSAEARKEMEKRLKTLKADLKSARSIFKAAVRRLLPMQRRDLTKMLRVMDGLPVAIRLFDPPLHEYLPHTHEDKAALADDMDIKLDELERRLEELNEVNPMLGHRGCRLGITYPELYRMQVRAIMQAACRCKAEGIKVLPEIMIPLVGTREEFAFVSDYLQETCREVIEKEGVEVDYMVGTMIEVPRAALTADELAEVAEFFSFGTNDLTQMTYGFSRDDAQHFLKDYLDLDILPKDPFRSLDISGVGQLIRFGTEQGRKTRPELQVGISGEHGGDPASIELCYLIGMNYVSCSPRRVPVARLAAAQAALHQQQEQPQT